jgi:hypothetical protein
LEPVLHLAFALRILKLYSLQFFALLLAHLIDAGSQFANARRKLLQSLNSGDLHFNLLEQISGLSLQLGNALVVLVTLFFQIDDAAGSFVLTFVGV